MQPKGAKNLKKAKVKPKRYLLSKKYIMEYYTYLLLDPLNCYLPFYIGKGKGKRAYIHNRDHSIRNDKNLLKTNILKNLRKNGLKVKVYIWEYGLTEAEAFNLEIELIKTFGRRIDKTGILTNLTEGGDGFSGLSGIVLSEHNKERWRNPSMRKKLINSMKRAQTANVRKNKSETVKNIWSDKEYKKSRIDKQHGEIILEEKVCETCKEVFVIKYREKGSKRKTEQMNRRFCSKKCAAKNNVKIMTQTLNNMLSDEKYRKDRLDKIHGKFILEEKTCEICGEIFTVKYRGNPSKIKTKRMNRRFCNKKCASKNNVKEMMSKH